MSELEKTFNKNKINFENESEVDYHTLGRRFFSKLFDVGILFIVDSILILIFSLFFSKISYLVYIPVLNILTLFYNVITTKLLGGTFGKLYFRINVLKNVNEIKLSWTQSVIRELIDLLSGILTILPMFIFMFNNDGFNFDQYKSISKTDPIISLLNLFLSGIILTDFIVAIISKKRRAIHDLMGGSIVKIIGNYRKHSKLITIIFFIISGMIFIKIMNTFIY